MQRYFALHSIIIAVILSVLMVFMHVESTFSETKKNIYTVNDIETYFSRYGIDLIKESSNLLNINNQYGKQYSIKQSPNYQFVFYVYKNGHQVEKAKEEFLYRTKNLDMKDFRIYRVKNILAIIEGINGEDEICKNVDRTLNKAMN